MTRSTFKPQPKEDNNIVDVHTELGKPTPIYKGKPAQNAAGSLLTTPTTSHDKTPRLLPGINKQEAITSLEPTSAPPEHIRCKS